MAGALEGVRVIEVGLLVQGPQATQMLSDMGADVVKVELPDFGDQARWIPISEEDRRSAYFIACNRGKRSITIDLRTPAGAGIFRTMARTSDVIVSNFKPGTLDGWGLGYDALAEINPGLVWAAGSTFGPTGPDAELEGADLAGQAAGGLISTIGQEGAPLSPVGVTIADHIASLNLVSGILAALYARRESGRGQRIEVSLLGGQIWAQAAEFTNFLLTGDQRSRANFGHPLLRGLYGIFETRDGWIGLIGVPTKARESFFELIQRPDLLADPRLQTIGSSLETYQWIYGELAEIFRRETTGHWCEQFRAAGVRFAPVRNYDDVTGDPGAWENGYFAEVRDGNGGRARVVGTPIAMSGTPLQPSAVAPELGAHTEELLLEFGFDWEAITGFRDKRVI